MHEGGRFCLEQAFNGVLGDDITVTCGFRHDIQQIYRDSGVSDMGGDAGAHHAGTDDRDFLDVHEIASRIVAMPCPPPMQAEAMP